MIRRSGRRFFPSLLFFWTAPGAQNRVAPHNLYAHPAQLLAEAPGASTAHDMRPGGPRTSEGTFGLIGR